MGRRLRRSRRPYRCPIYGLVPPPPHAKKKPALARPVKQGRVEARPMPRFTVAQRSTGIGVTPIAPFCGLKQLFCVNPG